MSSSKWLVGAVSMVLMASAANAENRLEKEEGAGMFTGAAMGAVVGGPIGAVVGLFVGGITGDLVSSKRHSEEYAAAVEKELQDARITLAGAEQQLKDTQLALAEATAHQDSDPFLSSLAERLHGEVLFRTGSAELDGPTQLRLAELGAVLAQQSIVSIELDGFADPRGSQARNLELSQARAAAVRDALMAGGLPLERIQLAAHGESKTTAIDGDTEAYAWERRVSVAIRATEDAKLAKR